MAKFTPNWCILPPNGCIWSHKAVLASRSKLPALPTPLSRCRQCLYPPWRARCTTMVGTVHTRTTRGMGHTHIRGFPPHGFTKKVVFSTKCGVLVTKEVFLPPNVGFGHQKRWFLPPNVVFAPNVVVLAPMCSTGVLCSREVLVAAPLRSFVPAYVCTASFRGGSTVPSMVGPMLVQARACDGTPQPCRVHHSHAGVVLLTEDVQEAAPRYLDGPETDMLSSRSPTTPLSTG